MKKVVEINPGNHELEEKPLISTPIAILFYSLFEKKPIDEIKETLSTHGKNRSLANIRYHVNALNQETHEITKCLKRKLDVVTFPQKKVRYTNEEQRIQMRALSKTNLFTNQEIAKMYNFSSRTVQRVCNNEESIPNKENLSRSPLKDVSNADFEGFVNYCHVLNGSVSKSDLRDYLSSINISISLTVLAQELKNRGYSYKKQKVVPALTENHRLKRLEHALFLHKIDITNFIFSDESYVKMDRNTILSWSKIGKGLPVMQTKMWKLELWFGEVSH